MRLSCKMYIEQMNEGNDFVHEHPHGASSWSTDVVKELLCRDDVYWVRMDMCSAGTKAKRRDGTEGPARKTSGWITSAREVAEELSRFQCPNRAATPEDPEPHDHVHLVDGKARATEQ